MIRLKTLFSNKFFCTVTLNEDSKFRFQLNDHYWNRLIWKGCNYEDEIAFVLEELKLKVFYLDERKRMIVVSNVKEINRVKTQPNKGYNFFAVNKNSVFDKN